MLPMILLAALLTAPAAFAQDAAETHGDEGGAKAVRRAIPREAAPPPAARPQPAPPPVASGGTRRLERSERSAPPQEQAVPRGNRSRGDNPVVGTAVPRESRPAPGPAGPSVGGTRSRTVVVPDRGRTVIVAPPAYRNYYYYPPHYDPYGYGYPYGYGAFGGLGYFYYDPYTWSTRGYNSYGSYYGSSGGHYDRYRGLSHGWDAGELRLDVSPRHAQVFVDGYYVGTVDNFDGVFQGLKLEPGTYRIEIVASGYQTLQFDVRITPRQKISYRGELQPF